MRLHANAAPADSATAGHAREAGPDGARRAQRARPVCAGLRARWLCCTALGRACPRASADRLAIEALRRLRMTAAEIAEMPGDDALDRLAVAEAGRAWRLLGCSAGAAEPLRAQAAGRADPRRRQEAGRIASGAGSPRHGRGSAGGGHAGRRRWDGRWRRPALASLPSPRPSPFLPFASVFCSSASTMYSSTISRSLGRLAARFIAIRWSSEATRTATLATSARVGVLPQLLVGANTGHVAENVEDRREVYEGEVGAVFERPASSWNGRSAGAPEGTLRSPEGRGQPLEDSPWSRA